MSIELTPAQEDLVRSALRLRTTDAPHFSIFQAMAVCSKGVRTMRTVVGIVSSLGLQQEILAAVKYGTPLPEVMTKTMKYRFKGRHAERRAGEDSIASQNNRKPLLPQRQANRIKIYLDREAPVSLYS